MAGTLFGIEFVLIFTGLVLTSASRAAVFLYTAPFFVALGSYVFLGERLRAPQWGGLALSFAGVALAIGVPQANVDAKVLLGDLLIVAGGALWATTTLIVKTTALIKAPRGKGARLSGGAIDPDSRACRVDIGRNHHPRSRAAVAGAAGLSGVLGGGSDVPVVVRAGKTYSASKLSAFTFVTPLFGVVASYFILHDTLTIAFGVAALLVIAGLYLVNKPDPKVVPDPNVPA